MCGLSLSPEPETASRSILTAFFAIGLLRTRSRARALSVGPSRMMVASAETFRAGHSEISPVPRVSGLLDEQAHHRALVFRGVAVARGNEIG
jgi:hypothetical protein